MDWDAWKRNPYGPHTWTLIAMWLAVLGVPLLRGKDVDAWQVASMAFFTIMLIGFGVWRVRRDANDEHE